MKEFIIYSTQKNPVEIRIYNSGFTKKAAIIAHPYALLGGNFNNHVIIAIAETLLSLNYLVITFNFRGALRSKGRTSWSGHSEQQDFQTVINYAFTNFPEIDKIILGGYSYGSIIAYKMDPPISNTFFLLISPPLPPLTYFLGLFFKFTLNDSNKKGLIIYGGKDFLVSLFSWKNYHKFLASLNNPNIFTTIKIDNAGHFWIEKNALQTLLSNITNWINSI